jgi:hypothetical protein
MGGRKRNSNFDNKLDDEDRSTRGKRHSLLQSVIEEDPVSKLKLTANGTQTNAAPKYIPGETQTSIA